MHTPREHAAGSVVLRHTPARCVACGECCEQVMDSPGNTCKQKGRVDCMLVHGGETCAKHAYTRRTRISIKTRNRTKSRSHAPILPALQSYHTRSRSQHTGSAGAHRRCGVWFTLGLPSWMRSVSRRYDSNCVLSAPRSALPAVDGRLWSPSECPRGSEGGKVCASRRRISSESSQPMGRPYSHSYRSPVARPTCESASPNLRDRSRGLLRVGAVSIVGTLAMTMENRSCCDRAISCWLAF